MESASARPAATAVPCAPQYCKSIERDADPQPSSVCFTKGTSSHTPALSCAAGAALPRKRINKEPRARRLIFVKRRLLTNVSANCERNDKDRHDNQNDPQQIAVGKTSGCEILLCLTRLLSQFCEILIAQLAYGLVDFLQVEVGRFQSFLPIFRGKKVPHGRLVRLPHFSGPGRIFLQLVQCHHMLLFLPQTLRGNPSQTK